MLFTTLVVSGLAATSTALLAALGVPQNKFSCDILRSGRCCDTKKTPGKDTIFPLEKDCIFAVDADTQFSVEEGKFVYLGCEEGFSEACCEHAGIKSLICAIESPQGENGEGEDGTDGAGEVPPATGGGEPPATGDPPGTEGGGPPATSGDDTPAPDDGAPPIEGGGDATPESATSQDEPIEGGSDA